MPRAGTNSGMIGLAPMATKGLQARLVEFGRAADQKVGVLSKVASTDVLQAIALRHTKKVRG